MLWPSAFRNSTAEVLRAPMILNSYRLEDMVQLKFTVFGRFPFSRLLCDQTRLLQPQRRTNRPDTPKPRLTILPRDQRKPIWPFDVRPVCISLLALSWMEYRQSWWLARQYRSGHGMVPGNSARCLSANQFRIGLFRVLMSYILPYKPVQYLHWFTICMMYNGDICSCSFWFLAA